MLVVLIVIMAFVIGILAHIEYTRSMGSIRRKAFRFTADEIAQLRDRIYCSNVEAERIKHPYRIPRKYWNEITNEYIKWCVKLEDSDENDIIKALNKFRGLINKEAISTAYHILMMNYIKGKVYDKNKEEWDKELGA